MVVLASPNLLHLDMALAIYLVGLWQTKGKVAQAWPPHLRKINNNLHSIHCSLPDRALNLKVLLKDSHKADSRATSQVLRLMVCVQDALGELH